MADTKKYDYMKDVGKTYKNKNIHIALNETLKLIKLMGDYTYTRVIEDIRNIKTEEEMIVYLTSRIPIAMEQFKEIPKEVIRKIIDDEKIITTERVHLPHMFKDENGVGILTEKEHMIIPVPVRANQQKSFKEGKSAKDASKRNIMNQVSGESKTGTLSDTEIVTLTSHDADNILREVGVVSHDAVAYSELTAQIIATGEASLEGLTNESSNKGSLLYMNEILKAMGFDTDIIETPER